MRRLEVLSAAAVGSVAVVWSCAASAATYSAAPTSSCAGCPAVQYKDMLGTTLDQGPQYSGHLMEYCVTESNDQVNYCAAGAAPPNVAEWYESRVESSDAVIQSSLAAQWYVGAPINNYTDGTPLWGKMYQGTLTRELSIPFASFDMSRGKLRYVTINYDIGAASEMYLDLWAPMNNSAHGGTSGLTTVELMVGDQFLVTPFDLHNSEMDARYNYGLFADTGWQGFMMDQGGGGVTGLSTTSPWATLIAVGTQLAQCYIAGWDSTLCTVNGGLQGDGEGYWYDRRSAHVAGSLTLTASEYYALMTRTSPNNCVPTGYLELKFGQNDFQEFRYDLPNTTANGNMTTSVYSRFSVIYDYDPNTPQPSLCTGTVGPRPPGGGIKK